MSRKVRRRPTQPSHPAQFHPLESRRHLAADPTVELADGVVRLTGTSEADIFTISSDTLGNWTFDVGTDSLSTPSSDIQRIEIALEGGDDSLTVKVTTGSSDVPVIVDAGDGQDFVSGLLDNTVGRRMERTGETNATILSLDISGGDGDDSLFGGSGDDTLDGGLGADWLDGQLGYDTVTYRGRSVGITATVGAIRHLNSTVGDDGAPGEGDRISPRVERVLGTEFADTIDLRGYVGPYGHPALRTTEPDASGDGLERLVSRYATRTGSDTWELDEAIFNQLPEAEAFDGDDTILGPDGLAFRARGGAGDDAITSDSPADSPAISRLFGNAGDDTLVAGKGRDFLYGDDGSDELTAAGGFSRLVGGAGNDLYNGYGRIELDFRDAPAAVAIDFRSDTQSVEHGADTTLLAFDTDKAVYLTVRGTAYDDHLTAGRNSVRFFGYAGNDTLIGSSGGSGFGAGNDFLAGGAGDDRLEGNGGRDVLLGDVSYAPLLPVANVRIEPDETGGTLRLLGGSSYDPEDDGPAITLDDVREAFMDLAYSATDAGRDTLLGGADNDTLVGGYGDDELDGGEGINVASYGGHAHGVAIRLDQGIAGRMVDGEMASLMALTSEQVARGVANLGEMPAVELVERDVLRNIGSVLGSNQADLIVGNDAADSLFGGDGDDLILGGGGKDSIEGGEGQDILDGGIDHDVFFTMHDRIAPGQVHSLLLGGGGIDSAVIPSFSVIAGRYRSVEIRMTNPRFLDPAERAKHGRGSEELGFIDDTYSSSRSASYGFTTWSLPPEPLDRSDETEYFLVPSYW